MAPESRHLAPSFRLLTGASFNLRGFEEPSTAIRQICPLPFSTAKSCSCEVAQVANHCECISASDARHDSPVTDCVTTGTAELATSDETSVICGARSEVVLIEVGTTSGDPILAVLVDVARVEQAGCELADRSNIRTCAVGQDANDLEVGGGLVLGNTVELEELLVEVVVRDEDEVELEDDVEVLPAREEDDELDTVDDEVEPDVLVVVAGVDVLIELELVDASVFAWTLTLLDVEEVAEEDDDLVKVENVEALDEELEEALVDDVEDEKATAVLEKELVELEESVEDVEVLVVDADELVLDAKLAALTVTLEDEVLEGMLLELLLLLVEAPLLVALVLLLLVLLVVGTRVAGLTVTLVEEYEEVLSVLLVVGLLVVVPVVELLTVALLDVEIKLAWFAVSEVVELLEKLLEELLEVLLRDAVLDIELLVVETLVEVLVVELVVDNRVAALTVTLEEVGDELRAELLDDGLVVVPLLMVTEIEELAEVGDVELVEELLLGDALLVVDTSEAAAIVRLEEDDVPVDELLKNLLVLVEVMLLVGAELKELAVVLDDELMTEILLVGVPMVEVDIKVAALTVGLDEVDEDDVVPTEELLVALGEELVVAVEDEDETVERLLVEALLVVDRRVAALTVGLDEEDKEGEEDVLERLLVVTVLLLVEMIVDELADGLEEGKELLAELLEGAAVELVLGDSNEAGLTVALMVEVVLGTVLLIVEPTLNVELEDDDGLLAEVLEGDPAALLVVGSSVAALAVGLSDAKLLSELLLDAISLEVELELTAELEDGEELLLVAAFAVGLADDDDVLEVIDEELLGGVEILLDLLVEALEAVGTNVAGLTDTLEEVEPVDDGMGDDKSVDKELPKRPLEDDVDWETGLLIDGVGEAKIELEELELWPAEVLVDVGSNVAAFGVGVVEEESLDKRLDRLEGEFDDEVTSKLVLELKVDVDEPLEESKEANAVELVVDPEVDVEEALVVVGKEVEDVLATLPVAKVLEEPTELELDNSVVLVVDDDDGVNDVDNKDAGSTLRLDVDEITVEEALERSLELLWKSWLEPLLEVDEDITVDSDEDSDVEPDERSSELDEALVEDALVVGSKVLSSAMLAIVDDVIPAMLEDGSEGLLELILEVEDDGGESELEDELVEAALVLDSKGFGSTVSVVLVEVALAPVGDVLGSGSNVEELESIELDNPGERSVDVDLEVEAGSEAELDESVEEANDDEEKIEVLIDEDSDVEGVTPGAVAEVDDDEDVGEEVLVVLADDDSDRVVEVSALLVALEDAEVKEAEDESKVELEIVNVISAVELTEDVDKLEEDDSELGTKLAGSAGGELEDRDSPIEVDDEESEKLDVASTELSELDSDEELRSEIDEEREDVKPVVGNSVDVETRLAGSIVGDEDGDVDVVTDEDIDVTDAASSELDWGVEEVDMTIEVLVGEDTEDSVELAIELDGDRESLSEELEVVELKSRVAGSTVKEEDSELLVDVLVEESVGVIVISSELACELTESTSVIGMLIVTEEEGFVVLIVDVAVETEDDSKTLSKVLDALSVKVLCEVGSRLSGLIVRLGEAAIVLETSEEEEATSDVELTEVAVMVLELVEVPEEGSKASNVVDEFTFADECGIEEGDPSISVELEPCSVDGLDDVNSRLLGSTVTLEDETSVKEPSDVVVVLSRVGLLESDCGKVDVGVGVEASAPLEVEELLPSLVGRLVEEGSVFRSTATLELEVMESEPSLPRTPEESAADEDVLLVMDDNGSDVAVKLDADETPDELLDSKDEKLVSVPVVADTIDVGSKVLISAVACVLEEDDESSIELEDEDESSGDIEINDVLGPEAEMLVAVKISLEKVLVELGSKVSGSSVVAVIEVEDENSAEELVEVSFSESLVDAIVVAALGVDVSDGDCELLLVVDSESNEDVGLRRAESLDEITDVLLSTPDKKLLDVIVGDSVSRPIVSKELEYNRDDEEIGVE
ncbi:hypothetical protein CSIM01_00753 [Colletotrichum simmondsii]|uniref:Uncharacterized protein n=1 Tax=Colletotrichum simmondsii TaxID=703756 RepID=A0A135S2D3_9PEZI|nr:hypothetical protein CSIM01_00753 [Colletotrichum simmondsii]